MDHGYVHDPEASGGLIDVDDVGVGAHDAILDRALVETYRQKGITPDPATQKKTPPLMEDLYKTLLGMEDAIRWPAFSVVRLILIGVIDTIEAFRLQIAQDHLVTSAAI